MKQKRKPQTHDLKCWPEFFRPLCQGIKTFEVRLNDRNYQVGDTLQLWEWKPEKKEPEQCQIHDCNMGDGRCTCHLKKPRQGKYTGAGLKVRVTYLTEYSQQHNYVVMAVERLARIQGAPKEAKPKPAPAPKAQPVKGRHSTLTWIPVEKELPDDDIEVLLADTGGNLWLGCRSAGRWLRNSTDDLLDDCEITHWADLPASPL